MLGVKSHAETDGSAAPAALMRQDHDGSEKICDQDSAAVFCNLLSKLKIRIVIVLTLAAGWARTTTTIRAQEAMDADLQPSPTQSKTPAPANTPLPSPSPADILSSAGPNVPELSQIDEAFKHTSLGKEADDRRLHLQWRELANRVVNDPEIAVAKKSVASARTDLEKRNRLRVYYNVYYGKMRLLAQTGEMKTALDQLKMAHLSQINQPRVRHETDAALPTPSPSARKHGH